MTSIPRDWGQFALPLIEVQRDFWGEETGKSFPRFSHNVASLLRLCRTQGIQTVHLRARLKPFLPQRSDSHG